MKLRAAYLAFWLLMAIYIIAFWAALAFCARIGWLLFRVLQ